MVAEKRIITIKPHSITFMLFQLCAFVIHVVQVKLKTGLVLYTRA